ncbi:hypothetical protein [Ruminococcus flavefaciens]|uniref:hypothetical protein n=1 Tax=Ruminococcus flavefaciens TaxID=1265 RepID=UPI0026EF70DB|nr:hypothetical protein [Ruminococcus flavefaciens]
MVVGSSVVVIVGSVVEVATEVVEDSSVVVVVFELSVVKTVVTSAVLEVELFFLLPQANNEAVKRNAVNVHMIFS